MNIFSFSLLQMSLKMAYNDLRKDVIRMLGDRIYRLRKERHLTQVEVGTIIGVGGTTINGYERNIITPSPEKLVKMAKFFNVSLDYLLELTPIKKEVKISSTDISLQLNNIMDILKTEQTTTFDNKNMSKLEKNVLIKALANDISLIISMREE